MTEYMQVAEVLKPQGIRGEAKLKVYAANPDSFMKWKTLYRRQGDAYTPVGARCSRVADGFAYVTLDGCEKPEDVERLRGEFLYIDRAHAERLAKDAVYIADLIGCRAVDGEGVEIGTLTDVLQHGPVDVYVFKTPRGTMMAPAILAAFPEVDVENGRILVDRERLNEVAVFED